MTLQGDSPLLAEQTYSPPLESARIASGVSGLSEREMRHLRQISEATVSSTSETGHQEPEPITIVQGTEISPASPMVSPPTAEESPGDDYISSRVPVSPRMGSPLRRSVFHENEEDMGGRK
jgi:hypothetical protein